MAADDPDSDKIRVHILLFREDWDILTALFGTSMGRSNAIRTIVHDYITEIRARAARQDKRITLDDKLANNLATGLLASASESS